MIRTFLLLGMGVIMTGNALYGKGSVAVVCGIVAVGCFIMGVWVSWKQWEKEEMEIETGRKK